MKRDKPKPSSKQPRKPVKPQKPTKTTAAKAEELLGDADTRRSQRRVAMLRDKIRVAMDDPNKRQQIVEAIRVMMREE